MLVVALPNPISVRLMITTAIKMVIPIATLFALLRRWLWRLCGRMAFRNQAQAPFFVRRLA
jgi:hypothetical protein